MTDDPPPDGQPDIGDAVGVIGLALLAIGVALLTAPAAALVVIGVSLMGYAIAASRAK